jgi:hypothetical protein
LTQRYHTSHAGAAQRYTCPKHRDDWPGSRTLFIATTPGYGALAYSEQLDHCGGGGVAGDVDWLAPE